MATDPDDGDDEWRYSLSDLEDEDEGSDATESAAASDRPDDDEDGGISAGVAGRMDVQKELEAQEIDLENALFVAFGVLLALAFLAGFLNLFP